MPKRRPASVLAIAVLNFLFGVVGLIASTGMIGRGLGIASPGSDAGGQGPWAAFGFARLVVSLGLIASGAGMLRLSPWARSLAAGTALIWIALNLAEPMTLGYPYANVLLGSIYPLVLALMCMTPGGSRRFGTDAS